jgi:hypothetical protein
LTFKGGTDCTFSTLFSTHSLSRLSLLSYFPLFTLVLTTTLSPRHFPLPPSSTFPYFPPFLFSSWSYQLHILHAIFHPLPLPPFLTFLLSSFHFGPYNYTFATLSSTRSLSSLSLLSSFPLFTLVLTTTLSPCYLPPTPSPAFPYFPPFLFSHWS